MSRLRTFCLVTAVALTAPRAVAQPLAFERLDSRDGLSHNLVHALLQDRAGFVWIGTAGGLNRYDGTAFTVFRHRSGVSGSLASNTVRALAEDRDGALWVGTGGGLDRFDARRGHFVQVPLGAARLDGDFRAVAALAADSVGGIWAITLRGGLFHVRPGSGSGALVPIPAFVGAVTVDSSGTVWITTQPEPGTRDETVRRYDPRTDRFEIVATARWRDMNHSLAVLSDAMGTVWLRAPGDRSACDEAPLPCLPVSDADPVSSLAAERGGGHWFGTASGLLRYASASGTLTHRSVDAAPEAWLSNNVQALLRDRAGALWIGTLSGLYRHDPHRRPFEDVDLASASGRRDGAAMAVLSEPDGTLWVGTLGGGLVHVAPDGTRQRLTSDRVRNVWALHTDRWGTLWVGLADAGLCAFDRRARRFDCVDVGAGLIEEDAEGMLWVGGREGVRFDPVRRTVLARFAWPHRTALEGALLVGSDGPLWIGADGLYRCDAESGRCDRPAAEAQARAGLDRLSVYAIHADDSGTLWLGTTRGLARFDPARGAVRSYANEAAMEGLIVYSLLGGGDGSLWLGTSRGLVRFDPERETFRVFDPDDRPGLPEYNRRAAFRAADGRLVFGHLDGVTRFDPATIRDNPVRPATVLTRVSRTGSQGSADLDLHAGEPLALSYRDRLIRFEFVALNFTHAAENRYRYRLDGFDDGWVEAGTEQSAVYTNLPPGRYTFRVQGANNDGLWSEEAAMIPLVVAPPFWATAWFRVLAVLALGGLILLAHRYRVDQLLRVERVRASIASDLHDEVGSKLAALALASETVGRRADLAPPERRRLGEMADTARRMADDLRDIVWLANPRFDTLSDLVEKMRTTADAVLDGTAHTFVCTDAEAVQALDMEQRRQLFLLYKEALRNVARHAEAEDVTVRLACDADTLRLDVTDDGVGFDREAVPEATGLASLDDRARALGGTVEIDSQPGEGTRVRLRAPLRRMAGFREAKRPPRRLRSSS